METDTQFDNIIAECRDIFIKKMGDYGASWRIMRVPSVTDQLYIKACRIRGIEEGHQTLVNEGILPELIGLVNYSIIGLIQLELPPTVATETNLSVEKIIQRYDHYAAQAKQLMQAKNHDYGEAWRSMRTQSYTDLILMKIQRIKQIEDNGGHTQISEGIDANYFDIINYAIFGLIKQNEI